MRLEGIHHITCITGDAPGNVDFYVRVLGLRMVKKTVNQDQPTIYHLFYADERGSAGADITFFEFPGASPGRAGAGMVHRIVWRVTSDATLDFWEERLGSFDVVTERSDQSLVFSDPEGLGHELLIVSVDDEPLRAETPGIPAEHALQGFHAARAYVTDPDPTRALLEDSLGFVAASEDGAWEARGERRGGLYHLDAAPAERGLAGAGTVHHVAWAAPAELEPWRAAAVEAGARPTPEIDRFWFRSIYFREPSGVLFEIATLDPGFTADEPLESLGEKLTLPPNFESQRAEIEAQLTPLPSPAALRGKA